MIFHYKRSHWENFHHPQYRSHLKFKEMPSCFNRWSVTTKSGKQGRLELVQNFTVTET
jgi:hypothetical protein